MSRFRFRLEGVLRVRRAEESDARAALVTANVRLRQALEDRDRADVRYRQLLEGEERAGTFATFVRQRLEAGLSADRLELARRAATLAAGDAALAQVSWTKAARRVSVLERLEERRRVEHAEEENRAEVRAVDDLVAARWVSEGAERVGSP